MHAKLTRLRRQHAKTEADRKKASAKYDNLLDELNMSSDELLKELAFYKRRSDDLERDLENERKTWLKTLKVLEDENDELISDKKYLEESTDELQKKLENERKRILELEDDVETVAREKEDAEIAYRDLELKRARLLNEQTGLNLKVQDMYTKQAKYKKQIRTMHSSRDIRTDEAMSKAMRNMDDDDSYYDDRSHKEDDYKYSRKEDDRKYDRRSDRYETRGVSASPRGRSASPTPEWGD